MMPAREVSRHMRRQLDARCTLAATFVLILLRAAVPWTIQSPSALADSSGIHFTPTTGPAGTTLHVTIQPGGSSGPPTANYVLGVTTAAPAGPSCANPQ